MAHEAIPAFLEQIDELLAAPSTAEEYEPAALAQLERTLTDGYAHALSLEAEQIRLERRMSELAGELNEGNQEQKAAGAGAGLTPDLTREGRARAPARHALPPSRPRDARTRARLSQTIPLLTA